MNTNDAAHFTDMDGQPIEDSPAPEPCPFCGSGADRLVVERWTEEGDPDPSFHVECLQCGCNGPQAGSPLQAAEGWNERKVD